MTKRVDLYSDGSSRGNPGPGGYGTILRFCNQAGEVYEREFSCGFKQTTNNRMELLGVIVGMEALKEPCQVEVHTDSQYIAKAFNEHWIDSWIRSGWKTSSKKPVKNLDLWQRLLKASKQHDVNYKWVKGHAGHEFNERCDALATLAADGDEASLEIDEGFVPEAKLF